MGCESHQAENADVSGAQRSYRWMNVDKIGDYFVTLREPPDKPLNMGRKSKGHEKGGRSIRPCPPLWTRRRNGKSRRHKAQAPPRYLRLLVD